MYNEADQWPREEPMYYNSRPKDLKNNGYAIVCSNKSNNYTKFVD